MSTRNDTPPDRRAFLETLALGTVGAGMLLGRDASAQSAVTRPLTDKEKIGRLASTCWPPRALFKRPGDRPPNEDTTALRKQYGTITMLDFPQWTKDNYPCIFRLDLWSDVFGDPADLTQFTETKFERDGKTFSMYRWDPSLPSSKKWAETLRAAMDRTGTVCQHVSNNAPQNLADPDDEKRKDGIRVAKLWMDASAVLGAKTMRANTGVSGTRIMPEAVAHETGYQKNEKVPIYMRKCIESFRELAEYGEKIGVKITIENHWGLCANPMNIRIIMDEVNHPFCEATPDFCNWEHEYHLFHGIEALMPYTHTYIHAKYWDRWKTPEKDWNDVGRSVRILNAHGFRGVIGLEYENGPWNGIEGNRKLMEQVLAAL